MNDQLHWTKSSYSDSEGGACVEIALAWFKSSYSDDEGGNCVEVAHCDLVHVRDSKAAPSGPELRIAAPAWSDALRAVLDGKM